MQRGQAVSPAITLSRIAIMRGGRLVLRDFDLVASAGELIWVRGANGSGKSTLLRAIAGLLPVASGKAQVRGAVALCDDNLALDLDRSLEDALKFWTRIDGVSPARLEAALETLELVPLAELPVRLLSAGQRRRGALARMLAGDAPVWLFDEPYNGLDQTSVARLDAAIARHCERGGIALVASHIAPTVNVSRSIMLDAAQTRRAA